MEKRERERILIKNQLIGRLQQLFYCRIENISVKGIKIISAFMPMVAETYRLCLPGTGENRVFRIKVTRVEAMPMMQAHAGLSDGGMLFAIGAIFIDLCGDARQFLQSFLEPKLMTDATVVKDGKSRNSEPLEQKPRRKSHLTDSAIEQMLEDIVVKSPK